MKTSPTPAPTLNVRGPGGRAKLKGAALTPIFIKSMQPGDEYADPEHPGLRVRCNPSGSKVFFYRYKTPSGALRQIEVGVFGDKTLTTIRNEWQILRDTVRNGRDPQEAKRAERQAAVSEREAQRREILTVGDVVEQYLSENVEARRKTKGAAETRRLLEQVISFSSWLDSQKERDKAAGRRRAKLPKGVGDVAHLPADGFTRLMAHELLRAFGESAPRSGAMARQELRACWRYAISVGRLTGQNPFERMDGAKRDELGGGALVTARARDKVLSRDEIGLLLRWMAEPKTYSPTVRDALELVLRTGLRSGEVCGIDASELSRRGGVLWLDIPGERMKGKKPHSVPLVGRAEQIAQQRMPKSGGPIFPSTKYPDRPIEQKVLGVEVYACSGRSSAPAYKHRKVCPVGGEWTVHDLRRSVRTLLAELGCPYEVGEAILAHTLPGVASIYNRAQYEAQKIEWLTKLNEELDRLAAAEAKLELITAA